MYEQRRLYFENTTFIPYSIIFLKKLTVIHLVKKFSAIYGTGESLPYSQEPETRPNHKLISYKFITLTCGPTDCDNVPPSKGLPTFQTNLLLSSSRMSNLKLEASVVSLTISHNLQSQSKSTFS